MEINYDKDSNSDSSQSEQTSIIHVDSENSMLVSYQGTDSSSEEHEVKIILWK